MVSIKDHRVVSGNPKYSGNDTIMFSPETGSWTINLAYKTTFEVREGNALVGIKNSTLTKNAGQDVSTNFTKIAAIFRQVDPNPGKLNPAVIGVGAVAVILIVVAIIVVVKKAKK